MRKAALAGSSAAIRRALSGTRMAADPATVDCPDGVSRIVALAAGGRAATLIPAGVLVPLIERPEGLTVLMTERSADLKHHAGQVSFPGGRMEASDTDICKTALRETQEEVGIHPSAIEVVGYLPAMATITCYAMTPVVGFVDPAVTLRLDPKEVREAFEVPLDFLLDATNQEDAEREFNGQRIPVTTFRFGRQRIWGATAGVIVQFRKVLEQSFNT